MKILDGEKLNGETITVFPTLHISKDLGYIRNNNISLDFTGSRKTLYMLASKSVEPVKVYSRNFIVCKYKGEYYILPFGKVILDKIKESYNRPIPSSTNEVTGIDLNIRYVLKKVQFNMPIELPDYSNTFCDNIRSIFIDDKLSTIINNGVDSYIRIYTPYYESDIIHQIFLENNLEPTPEMSSYKREENINKIIDD